MANGHLTWPDFQLDPALKDAQVRVIVLVEEANDLSDDDWLKAATQNPAFDFLHDSEEDIYSVSDGKPFKP